MPDTAPTAAGPAPRGAALALLVLVGFPWVWLLVLLPDAAGPIWFLSALVLWGRALRRVWRSGGTARDVGRWWLSTLVAPAVLLVLILDSRSRRGPRAPAPEPAAPEAPAMTDPILIRLDAAEQQVRSLTRELRELRGLVAARTHPVAPVAPVAPAARPSPPAPAAAARPVAPPLSPPLSPPPPRKPARERPAVTLSDLLGARALAWAGGIVTLLGVVFLFVLAVNRGWIGPTERVLLGTLASALAFGAGVGLRRRYGQLDAAVAAAGAGLAGWYVTLLAAASLYDLVDHATALALAAAIAAVGTAVALAWSAEILAGIGLVGAALAPVAVIVESGVDVLGTAFAVVVLAAIAIVAQRRAWTWLLVAGVAATVPQAFGLVGAKADDSSAGAVLVSASFVAVLLAAPVVRKLGRDRLDAVSSTLVALSASLGVAASYALLDGELAGLERAGVALLVLALPYAAAAVALFGRDRDLSLLLAAAAMAVGALGLAEVLSGTTLALAWAVQAAALAWLAGRVSESRFAVASLAYLGIAIGHAVAFAAPPVDLYRAGADHAGGIPTLLVLAAAAALVARWAGRWHGPAGGEGVVTRLVTRVVGARAGWIVAAAAVSALAALDAASLGTLELVERAGAEPAFDWGRVGVVTLWSAVGAVAFAAGTWRRVPRVRVAGAVWLAVTVADAVAFDLVEPAETQRGWAALAVAAALLAGGYLAELVRDPRPAPGAAAVPLVAIIVSAGFAAVAAASLFRGVDPDVGRGFACLAAAAAYGLLAATLLPRTGRRDGGTALWSLGVAFGLAGSFLLLDGTLLVGALAAGAVALAAAARGTGERRLALGALAPLAAAAGVTFVRLAPPADLFSANETPADGALAVLLVAAAMAAGGALALFRARPPADPLDTAVDAVRRRVVAAFEALAAGLVLYAASLVTVELVLRVGDADLTTEFQRGHTAVSAVWGAVALGVLYLGLRRGAAPLRFAGFALFGAALVKLFLYDLSTLSSVTRALSFLALGAILLAAGFFYQRLSGPKGGGPRHV